MKKNKIKLIRHNGGVIYNGDAFEVINSSSFCKKHKGKINLIFTSPPFPLNNPKSYDNLKEDEYVEWFSDFAEPLANLLTPKGSIVVEIGNSWTQGEPTMSLVTYEALKTFMQKGNLKLCQEFIWHNPAKLPGPAQWVTTNRFRVKDSFTKIWWLSKTAYPYANNKNVLQPYTQSMKRLLKRQKYNSGLRTSGHKIKPTSFLKKNKGAIPSNVFNKHELYEEQLENLISIGNTESTKYKKYCKEKNLESHPATMPLALAKFFIEFLTRPGDKVLDPFAGSNTTGFIASSKKRKWVSIEKNLNYIKSGKGWFK